MQVILMNYALINMVSLSVRAHDKRIACDEEFSDSEDEAEGQGGGRRNAANHKKVKRVKKEEEKEGEEKKGKTCFNI